MLRVLEVGTTSHGLDGAVGTTWHRRSSPMHSFVRMHRITKHKVNIFVGDVLEIMCFVSARVLEVGTTLSGLDGVVRTVGHHRGFTRAFICRNAPYNVAQR